MFFLLGVGFYTTPCVLGLGIVWMVISSSVNVLLRGARAEPPVSDRPYLQVRPGTIAFFALGLVLFVTVSSGALVDHAAYALAPPVRALLFSIAVVLAAVAACVALSPAAFVPFALEDGAGFFRSFSESFELSAHVGIRRLAILGARAGALIGIALALPCILLPAFPSQSAIVLAYFGAPLPLAAAMLAAGAFYVRAYLDARERPLDISMEGSELRARTPILAAIPVLLLFVGALIVAALSPTEMRQIGWREQPQQGMELPPGRTIERGALRLRVFSDRNAVLVATRDGGGAGRIEAPSRYRLDWTLSNGARFGGPRGSYAITSENYLGSRALALIDTDGVRLDDGLHERVIDRLGMLGFGLLGTAVVLFAFLGFQLTQRIAEAAELQKRDDGTRADVRAVVARAVRIAGWTALCALLATVAAALRLLLAI